MAQASRMSKAIIYKKKGTHPMISRMDKEGKHMMTDKEMKEMKKKM